MAHEAEMLAQKLVDVLFKNQDSPEFGPSQITALPYHERVKSCGEHVVTGRDAPSTSVNMLAFHLRPISSVSRCVS